jgi:hypothetical protein
VLTSGSDDPDFPEDISGLACTGLSVTSQGTCGARDCRAACSTTPGCTAYQDGAHPGVNDTGMSYERSPLFVNSDAFVNIVMPALTLENDDGSTPVCKQRRVCEHCVPAHPYAT